MKNSKSLMFKAKFSNAVHKLLNPNPVRHRDMWKTKKEPLTDKQKIELFDKIVALDKQTSNELGSYFYWRRELKRINAQREARGYKRKVKTSKAQYEAMKQNVS